MTRARVRANFINRYLSDPQFRADMDAERAVERNKCNAAIDAGLAKYRAERGIS